MINRYKSNEFMAMIFFLILTVIYPIAGFITSILLVTHKSKLFSNIFLITILLIFCAVNLSRYFESDLQWYYDHYIWILNNGLDNYFNTVITGVSGKPTEPVMYLLYSFMGNVLGSNSNAFLIFFTILPYSIIIFALNRYFKIFNIDNKFWIFGVILLLCVGFTYTLSVHLMRQFLAQAIIFLSIAYFFENRKLIGLIFLVAAFLTHNSSLYIVFILILTYLSIFIFKRYKIIGWVFWGGVGFLVSYFLTNKLTSESSNLKYKDDGSISLLVYGLDFIIFCIVYFLKYSLKSIDRKSYNIYIFSLYFYIINIISLMGFYKSPLMYLRFGFYMEVVRVLMICVLIKLMSLKFKYHPIINILVFILGFIYLFLRLNNSDLTYDFKFEEVIFLQIFDL